jgi:type II secretory pathway pseudopilin PulG
VTEVRGRLARQDGFTVVEVLVAALVFAAGALAVLQVLDVSARNAYRAEQGQVGINVAQRELEKLRQLEYEEVALTAAPTYQSDPKDPRNRISGNNFALNPNGTNSAEMAIKGVGGQTGGSISPGPTPFTLGDVSGQIYRFVVWQDEPGCILVCPGTRDYKRVVVIVKIDNQPISYDRPYQEVQSDIGDPEASLTSGGGSGGGALITAQQFFLSDTPCSSASSEPARQDITADHATHDTLSSCQPASTGKPDALLFDQAPDPDPDDPSNPSLFDYSNELEPAVGNSDNGLQMLRQDTNGCDPTPTGADAKKKIHRWVTRPLPSTFIATGSATLEIFTRTIDDVNIPGAICMYLFKRATVAGVDIRTAIPLTGISSVVPDPFGFSCTTVGTPAVGKCSTAIWPRNSWGRARFNLTYAPNTTLLANERIELGLSVERGGTPQDALQFMYDHPDYSSRLEVKTTTPFG